MKLKTSVALTAIVTTCAAVAAGSLSGAIALLIGHILFWQNHVLEVKVNRLLNDRGLHVSDMEIDT